ncbi:unnamed protein product [Durusdinium trenchii]|uniref:Uncharacterized protein n=1 Tax=Durusdinium trenchii TaxID=1381693 RepID=A0ABP0QR25_9DINO
MMVSKVLCIYDFVSDVWAVQANAHSDKKPLHILGYLGAALLTVSCMVNMIIVRRVTRVHREKLFKGISKMAPLQYYMSRIFACSNPEVMCSFLIMRADANRPRQLQEIQVAIRELKEYGLVSQTFEDIPQLLVQAYSALLCIYHGWKVPVPVLASLCMSLAMVLVKLLGNCFVAAIGATASNASLSQLADDQNRHIDLPDALSAMRVLIQAVLLAGNIVFLYKSGPIPLPMHLPAGQLIGIISIILSYILSFLFNMLLVRRLRDKLWHALLNLELAVVLLFFGSLHPAALRLMDDKLPSHAGCWWRLLLIGPAVRGMAMVAVLSWAVWKSEFPVAENICILLLILNGIGLADLVASIDEINDDESNSPVRDIFTVAQVEEEDERLNKEAAEKEEMIKELEEHLIQCGFEAYSEILVSEGFHSKEQLMELTEAELVQLGLSQHEAASLQTRMQRVNTGDGAQGFLVQLRNMGVSTAILKGKTEYEVLYGPDAGQELPLRERKMFLQWRQERLQGQILTEDVVMLGMSVRRGPSWCYDSGDTTPEDGEGEGRVVAWRTSAGQVRGKPELAPSLCGWVRVEWLVTGYQKNYRLGAVGVGVTFTRDSDLLVATEDRINLAEVQKGELQLKHLRCTFGYKSGVIYPHYAKFDIRKEALEKVAAFQHGDVVVDKDDSQGMRSVCIGLKYDPDDQKVKMWFHRNGKQGAGLYSGIDLERSLKIIARTNMVETRRDELEAASDGEIEHDDREWVRQNLQPTLRYKTRNGQVLAFDTSAEKIAKFKVKFKSGDVIQDAVDHEKMTCIGVAADPRIANLGLDSGNRRMAGSIADLWFHVQGAPGAGVSPNLHKTLGKFTVVGNQPVHQGEIEETPAEKVTTILQSLDGNLECNYHFPAGAGSQARDKTFDVRPDVVKKVTGWAPGTVLSIGDRADVQLTLIGLRPDDHGLPAVWWHFQDAEEQHAGAGMMPGWESSPIELKDTGKRWDLEELKRELSSKAGPQKEQREVLAQLLAALHSRSG